MPSTLIAIAALAAVHLLIGLLPGSAVALPTNVVLFAANLYTLYCARFVLRSGSQTRVGLFALGYFLLFVLVLVRELATRLHRSHTVKKNLKELISGEESVDWLRNETERLRNLVGEEYGATASAGGFPVDDIYGNLPDIAWERLVHEFLLT